MAIFNGLLRKMKGNVGDMTFRANGGQTIVSERSRENRSKGEGATYAQRVQRCKLANVVNFYKVIRAFEAKAWEGKARKVSDYNMFAAKNLTPNDIYLPKNYAAAGACVAARYQVSQGSLRQIVVTWLGGPAYTDIAMGGLTIGAATTVGELSEAIIASNPDFMNGDKLTFGVLRTQYFNAGGQNLPGLSVEYIEFNLDVASTDVVANTLRSANGSLVSYNDSLAVQLEGAGLLIVHTRETNGKLFCSTQRVIMQSTSSSNPYGTDEWIEKCAASYGYQPTVLIQPGSEADAIQGATYFSINGTGVGEGVVNGSGRYEQGSRAVLTAVADSGYVLKGWYDNAEGTGDALSTAQQYVIESVSANVTVYAVFEEVGANDVVITATVSGVGGTVSGGGTYQRGDSVTLTATPSQGYMFLSWSDGNNSNPRTFTAQTNLTLQASFMEA